MRALSIEKYGKQICAHQQLRGICATGRKDRGYKNTMPLRRNRGKLGKVYPARYIFVQRTTRGKNVQREKRK